MKNQNSLSKLRFTFYFASIAAAVHDVLADVLETFDSRLDACDFPSTFNYKRD